MNLLELNSQLLRLLALITSNKSLIIQLWKNMLQTEFEFNLIKGYVDSDGNIHRTGIMRLSRAMDEIIPMRDPRVKSNPAYATVIILSRVIIRLGALDEITPAVIENLFAVDLSYLQNFYREINGLDENNNPIIPNTI